jgi:hypothetical protein
MSMNTTLRKMLTPSKVVVVALCSKHWMSSELDRYIVTPLGAGWEAYEQARDFIDAKAKGDYSWAYGEDLRRFINAQLCN